MRKSFFYWNLKARVKSSHQTSGGLMKLLIRNNLAFNRPLRCSKVFSFKLCHFPITTNCNGIETSTKVPRTGSPKAWISKFNTSRNKRKHDLLKIPELNVHEFSIKALRSIKTFSIPFDFHFKLERTSASSSSIAVFGIARVLQQCNSLKIKIPSLQHRSSAPTNRAIRNQLRCDGFSTQSS